MIFRFLRWNDAITEANQRVLIPPHNVKLIKWSFVETLRSRVIWGILNIWMKIPIGLFLPISDRVKVFHAI